MDGEVNTSLLILVNFTILELSFTLLLECDDDQGNKNVDKEERENNEEDNVFRDLRIPSSQAKVDIVAVGPIASLTAGFDSG